jgi:D-alanyl-D-alanine carboxypeptidase (penicillin-binding protein 5/6)
MDKKYNKRRRAKSGIRWDRVLSLLFLAALGVGITLAVTKIAEDYEPLPVSLDAAGYSQIMTEETLSPQVAEMSAAAFNADIPGGAEAAPVIAAVNNKNRYEIAFDPDGNYPIETSLRSAYVIVYDVTEKQVLFEKSADKKCFPASTTKLLTAAVLIETMPEDTLFTVGDEQELVQSGSSLAMLQRGSVIDLPTMIDALMLPSGNDAAYCAAAAAGRYIADDETLSPKAAVDVFMNRCNEVLHDIGAADTHFTVPDGFHDDEHYTTAADMLRITMHAMEYPLLMESVGKPDTTDVFETGETVYWQNSNMLIHEYSDSYLIYAKGMKTGMTDEAGYCVSALARRFDHDIICITMGASASDIRWNDTLALYDLAFRYIRSGEAITTQAEETTSSEI